MRKKYYFYVVLPLAALSVVCCAEHDMQRQRRDGAESTLSIAEARAFFENSTLPQMTRGGTGTTIGVFAVEEIAADWDRAEMSSVAHLASVDIPAQTGRMFHVLRYRPDGSAYEVTAYGKLLVVKSTPTGALATYMRFVIPDEAYATYYEGDLSDLYSNCEEREDYCGIELYTTLDGAIVGGVRYADGTPVTRVFLGDERLTQWQRSYLLHELMRGIHIRRSMVSGTRINHDWDFGGKSCFYDSAGTLYFVDIIDNVQYATMDFDGTRTCDEGGSTDRGGGSGGSGGGYTGPTGPGRGTGEGGPTGPGGPGFGGGGGGSGDGGQDDGQNGNEGDGQEGGPVIPPFEVKPPREAS